MLHNKLKHYSLINPFSIFTLKDGTTDSDKLLDAVTNDPLQLSHVKSLFDTFGSFTAGQVAASNRLYNKHLAYKTVTGEKYSYVREGKWGAQVVKSFLSKQLAEDV